jgi:hypothetical protein
MHARGEQQQSGGQRNSSGRGGQSRFHSSAHNEAVRQTRNWIREEPTHPRLPLARSQIAQEASPRKGGGQSEGMRKTNEGGNFEHSPHMRAAALTFTPSGSNRRSQTLAPSARQSESAQKSAISAPFPRGCFLFDSVRNAWILSS